MKKFTKLATLCTALLLCFGVTACGGGKGGNNGVTIPGEIVEAGVTEFTAEHGFEASDDTLHTIVVQDLAGNRFKGVRVHVCLPAELGGLCFTTELTDKNGEVVFSNADSTINGTEYGNVTYEVHLELLPEGYTTDYTVDEAFTITSYETLANQSLVVFTLEEIAA